MNLFLFGFCAAIISAIVWPSMLPLLSLPIIAGALLLCVYLHRKHRFREYTSGMAGVLVGVIWITAYCQLLLPSAVEDQQSSVRGHTTPLTVRAEIISLVSRNGDWISMDVQQMDNSASIFPQPKWRLGWDISQHKQNVTPPNVGEIWTFQLKVKVFSSVLNQGGFNQQRYLLSQHITGRATVISATKVDEISGLRARLLQLVSAQLSGNPQQDILLALIMGERSQITPERWQQLRDSGTAHLVAISGLHLSVISLYLFATFRLLSTRFFASESRRNLILANLSALLVTVAYAWLAGFGIPVQRALLMLIVIIISQLTMRSASTWERLLWALALVLCCDPLAPLSNGFRLSFFALALILSEWRAIDVNQHPQRKVDQIKRWAANLWRIQWRLTLGMSVLQGVMFGGISLHSFWINLLLVPWFSIVVIPCVMLAFCITSFAQLFGLQAVIDAIWHWVSWLLWPADKLWQWSPHLPFAWLSVPQTMAVTFVIAIAALVSGWYLLCGKQRYWLVVPCIPLLLHLAIQFDWLTPERWQIHVVDVGQGLAVVVQQGDHGLLYDTGASFDDFSYAERAVLPLLQAKGITQLDYLVISHGDNDHAGGAAQILSHYPNTKLITDLRQFNAYDDCRPHQLTWQRLTLSILGPVYPSTGNNGSCVMRISDGRFSVMLPGDIELPAEIGLTKRYQHLHSDLLIAPHHGSSTSSTTDFIEAVAPQWVIFAAGFHNRWQFPRAAVVEAYRQHDIQVLTSGEMGQISVDIGADSQKIATYRQQIAPYWYNRLIAFGNPVNPE